MISETPTANYTDYFPDYTEEELESLVKNHPRAVAAAHAYSLGLISLGFALTTALNVSTPRPTSSSPFAFTRLFHELATKIENRDLSIPPHLQDDYYDVYHPSKDAAVLKGYEGLPFSLSFQELNQPDARARYLALRRWRFNESDVREMIKNELFLACMDSWGKGIITGDEARERLVPDLKDLPRDLSYGAYLSLQTEVTRRILANELKLPPNLPERYPIAYRRRKRAPSEQ